MAALEKPRQHAAHNRRLLRVLAALLVGGMLLLLGGLQNVTRQLQPSQLLAAASARHHQLASAGASGATGALFSGEPQRSFSGERLLSRLPAPRSTPTAAPPPSTAAVNWAVMTTIHAPSAAFRAVAALGGSWSVVIVLDANSQPFNATHQPHVVLLDVARQRQLAEAHPGLMALLPWRHFGRKNVGYLYAILHGAQAVFDFDDDNILNPGTPLRAPEALLHVRPLNASCRGAWNPYPALGGPAPRGGAPPAWPRGFPLDALWQAPCAASLQAVPAGDSTDAADKIAVVQALADHDPDVDAIYRLTRGVPFYFNQRRAAPRTLVLPPGLLAPWNAQATLFSRDALWGLLLPVTVHGRVTDIWRSYVVQRLLWDVGQRVAFASPLVKQLRSPHNYLADLQAEQDLYLKSGKLVEFLLQWEGTADSLPGRFEELMIELYEREYIGAEDVALTQQWLLALHAGGYEWPRLQDTSSGSSGSSDAPPPVVARMPSRPQRRSAYWAVFVSDAAAPTAAIKQVAALDGWQVVVVSPGWEAAAAAAGLTQPWTPWPNVTHLTVQQQHALGWATAQQQGGAAGDGGGPAGRAAAVGALFAIQHGAQVVYTGDEAAPLLHGRIPVLTPVNASGYEVGALPARSPGGAAPAARQQQPGSGGEYTLLLHRSSSSPAALVNHFALVGGQPHLRPRGGARADVPAGRRVCFERGPARPLIQQSLVDGAADVDPAFHGSQPLDVAFDRSAFAVVLPRGAAAPLTGANTLHARAALWALWAPVSLPAGVADIVRGLWAQRLLWDIGGNAALLPPSARRHTPRWETAEAAAQAVLPHSLDSNDVLQMLAAATLTSPSLPGRMLEAAQVLVDSGVLQAADVLALQAWIDDLQTAGYTWPRFNAAEAAAPSSSSAAASGPDAAARPSGPALDALRLVDNGELDHSFAFQRRWCMLLDTSLVVNLNRADLEALQAQMRLLHSMYRPLFGGRVLFAGAHSNKLAAPLPRRLQRLAAQGYFISTVACAVGSVNVGAHAQLGCTAQGVLRAQAGVWRPHGQELSYHQLFINDDVPFSPCMLESFNATRFWFNDRLNRTVLIDGQGGFGSWWDASLVQRGTVREALRHALDNAWGLLATRIATRGLPRGRALPWIEGGIGQCDIFYVPARHQRNFAELAGHFSGSYVFNEIAIPQILGLLADGPDDIDLFSIPRPNPGPWRDCFVRRTAELLPLGAGINTSAAAACVPRQTWEVVPSRGDLFTLHPLKLSARPVVRHFLRWWLSQECVSS